MIEAVSATAPVKPYCGEMVRVVVAFVPLVTGAGEEEELPVEEVDERLVTVTAPEPEVAL